VGLALVKITLGGMIIDMDDSNLLQFYDYVYGTGKLRTVEHARRWSNGVLNTLGLCLDRGTKKNLAKKLPEELTKSLKGVFWLLYFRDPQMSSEEFLSRAARRSGNTDAEFAYYPTLAVFSGLKHFIDSDLEDRVSKALSQEVQELWQKAERAKIAA
jgi:uncharacterized protein (DUF2267 family)